MSPVLYAILAAIAFGAWTVFHRLAGPYVNQVFGAVIVSLTAVVLGALVLTYQTRPHKYVTSDRGVWFLVLAGISAFFIDYFALKTYSSGLPVTVGGPIIIGGSIAVATIIGFALGDSFTWPKLLGLALLIAGAAILATYQ